MKPLIVLISVSSITLIVLRIVQGNYDFSISARFGLSVMLLFTALGHFMFTHGMSNMVPDFIPFKKEIVYITAFIEISAAIGLHIPQFRTITAWLLIIFFVLILPANIKAALVNLNYQTGDLDGPGTPYLWFRIPFQLLLICWVYLSSIHQNQIP